MPSHTPVILRGGPFDGQTGEMIPRDPPLSVLQFVGGSAWYAATKRHEKVQAVDERTGKVATLSAAVYQWDKACPLQAEFDKADAEARAEVAATKRRIITETVTDETGHTFESKGWEQ